MLEKKSRRASEFCHLRRTRSAEAMKPLQGEETCDQYDEDDFEDLFESESEADESEADSNHELERKDPEASAAIKATVNNFLDLFESESESETHRTHELEHKGPEAAMKTVKTRNCHSMDDSLDPGVARWRQLEGKGVTGASPSRPPWKRGRAVTFSGHGAFVGGGAYFRKEIQQLSWEQVAMREETLVLEIVEKERERESERERHRRLAYTAVQQLPKPRGAQRPRTSTESRKAATHKASEGPGDSQVVVVNVATREKIVAEKERTQVPGTLGVLPRSMHTCTTSLSELTVNTVTTTSVTTVDSSRSLSHREEPSAKRRRALQVVCVLKSECPSVYLPLAVTIQLPVTIYLIKKHL
jgi:hypothetical protein